MPHDGLWRRLMDKGTALATYIWIADDGKRLGTKVMKLYSNSSGRIKQDDFYLKPVAVFNDPFSLANNKLILCETVYVESVSDKATRVTNKRAKIVECAQKAGSRDEPIFSLEQEFTMLTENQMQNLETTDSTSERTKKIPDIFYKSCITAGIDIVSCEAVPRRSSKWCFKLKPQSGSRAYDHLWMARYILYRLTDQFGLTASLDDPLAEQKSKLRVNDVLIKFSTTKTMQNDPQCPVLNVLGALMKAI